MFTALSSRAASRRGGTRSRLLSATRQSHHPAVTATSHVGGHSISNTSRIHPSASSSGIPSSPTAHSSFEASSSMVAAAARTRALLGDVEMPALVSSTSATATTSSHHGNKSNSAMVNSSLDDELATIGACLKAATGDDGDAMPHGHREVLRRSWLAASTNPTPLQRPPSRSVATASSISTLATIVAPSRLSTTYTTALGTERATQRLQEAVRTAATSTQQQQTRGSRTSGQLNAHNTAVAAAAQREADAIGSAMAAGESAIDAWRSTQLDGMHVVVPTSVADRIRIGLHAAIAATATGTVDVDTIEAITMALVNECASAEREVAAARAARESPANHLASSSSSSANGGYFLQLLEKICATATPSSRCVMAVVVSRIGTTTNDAAAVVDASDSNLSLKAAMVCLASLSSASEAGGATAKGASGHPQQHHAPAGLNTAFTSVLGMLQRSGEVVVEALKDEQPREAFEEDEEGTSSSSAPNQPPLPSITSATDAAAIEATMSLMGDVAAHLLRLAELYGSFSTLMTAHDGVLEALPYLVPPQQRLSGFEDEGVDASAKEAAVQMLITQTLSPHIGAAARETGEGGVRGRLGAAAVGQFMCYSHALVAAVSTIASRNMTTSVIATRIVTEDGTDRHIPKEALTAVEEMLAVVSVAQRLAVEGSASTTADHHTNTPNSSSPADPATAPLHPSVLPKACRATLDKGLKVLAQSNPDRVIALHTSGAVPPSATIMDAYTAKRMYAEATAVLKAVGVSRGDDGWANPPQTIVTSAQRLALGIGVSGSPRHVKGFADAIHSFRCPHMWLGVFLDFTTAGIAMRVQKHGNTHRRVDITLHTAASDAADREPASSSSSSNNNKSMMMPNSKVTLSSGWITEEEITAHRQLMESFAHATRDMIRAVAMQRSADTSADPVLELMQECAWHPQSVALLEAVVDNYAHLFACYPRTFTLAPPKADVPKEHRSRSWQFNNKAPTKPEAPITTRLVGTFLHHSTLCFLRDNKLHKTLKALTARWQLSTAEVALLLNRDPTIAPSTQLWECRSCSRLNNARYMYCSCTALRYGSIVCPSCGLGQPGTNCSCAACGTDFVGDASKDAGITNDFIIPRAPWSCKGCGAANSAYQTVFCCKCKTATGPLANALVTKETCHVCKAPNPLGFALYPVCVECGACAPSYNTTVDGVVSTSAAAKAWRCDSCGEWAPTTIDRCPHCPHIELRGASAVRDLAHITCSSCGATNHNALLTHCESCDSPLEGQLPTIVDVCTECFSANTHEAEGCVSCDAKFEPIPTDALTPRPSDRVTVRSYFRYCKSCQHSVSPYNLSCVCDRCDAFLPFFTTPTGDPIVSAVPDAVGIVATCETILRRLDKEPDALMVPIAEGFLLELTAASHETITIARPLLNDVVVHFGQLFTLQSLVGCRGLALTLAMAHYCGCEITEGRLVDLDRRVVTAFDAHSRALPSIAGGEVGKPAAASTTTTSSTREEPEASPVVTSKVSAEAIADFAATSSSDATAHNMASLLFAAAVSHTTPSAANRLDDVVEYHERHLSDQKDEGGAFKQRLCSHCLSPHPESMCRFNTNGWDCSECGKHLENSDGFNAVMCPSCYQVRPELESCLEVWECPMCARCSPETELFCLYCNTHKEAAAAAKGGEEGVVVLPFLPVACGLCARPHLEALCPYCTAVPPTRVTGGTGTITVLTDRYAFLQPMGTFKVDDRVFVPIQLAGELFVGQQVVFDAEEGKPGQLKATRVVSDDDE